MPLCKKAIFALLRGKKGIFALLRGKKGIFALLRGQSPNSVTISKNT